MHKQMRVVVFKYSKQFQGGSDIFSFETYL